MYVCMYVCIYIYVCIYTYILILISLTCIFLFLFVFMYIYICMQANRSISHKRQDEAQCRDNSVDDIRPQHIGCEKC